MCGGNVSTLSYLVKREIEPKEGDGEEEEIENERDIL